MSLGAVFISVGLAAMPSVANGKNDGSRPSAGGSDWPLLTPERVGLAATTLHSMIKWLDVNNVHAVLVVRHGSLVFEQYFCGNDKHGGQPVEVAFGPEVKHDERSVTKSIVALVVGIAIDRGWIKGADERVLSFFPEYADLQTPQKTGITLRHLLTMSAGLEWHELDTPYSCEANSENLMDNAPDPFRYVLEQIMVTAPGQSWNYSSGSTELLGAVLQKATGQPLDELAHTVLFRPMGIGDVEWYKHVQGHPNAAAGLRMRPRDLATVGQLVLQGGVWNGNQVVRASWVDRATTLQIKGPSSILYGYQFWLERSLVGQHDVDWAVGIGFGGQRLCIAPTLDLVVVVNAGVYENEDLTISVPLTILNEYVLKAMEAHA